jgi:hypothetical protein
LRLSRSLTTLPGSSQVRNSFIRETRRKHKFLSDSGASTRRRKLAIASVVLIVVVGVGLVLTSSPAPSSKTEGGNLLTNGGFETGNMEGWKNGSLLVPDVESTIVDNGTYAARFQTTGNGAALNQCTLHALECSLLNSSTISQDLSGLTISPNTTLSIALYPSFQAPSTFQVTLDFGLTSQHGTSEVTIYYIYSASSEQCDTYSQLLVNGSQYARAFCSSAQQGEWTVTTRNISNDIPAAIRPSDLDGSSLTLSLSFAGGNSADATYVDSVYLGR